MSEFLTIEHFKPLVGKPFGLRGTGRTLVLDRIHTDNKPLFPGAQRIAFNLIFAEPKGADVLLGGTYELEAPTGAVWPVHVMPIQTMLIGRQEYQALFD